VRQVFFKDPWVLLFLPLIIFLTFLLRKRDTASSIRFSSVELLKQMRPTLKLRLAKGLSFLRMTVIILLLFALARPRFVLEETRIETEGIDIVLAIDTSTSMLAEDFKVGRMRQNRLEAVKKVVEDFIGMRRSDRIGMVAFAARAYTVCPLTLDLCLVDQQFRKGGNRRNRRRHRSRFGDKFVFKPA